MSKVSQYLCSFLIKCILLNILISVSLCDNISHFRIVFYNNSTLEIDEYLDANSSVIGHKSLSSPKTSHHKNHSIYKNNRSSYGCSYSCTTSDGEICCEVSENKYTCVYAHLCRDDYKCNSTADCVEGLGLQCLPTSSHKEIQSEDNQSRKCQCEDDFYFDDMAENKGCVKGNYDSKTAMQIYKITMIFASCCLALILIIFLVCILRKSYCAPRNQRMVPLDNSTIPDIFTLFPHVGNYEGGPLGDGTQPPFEKPPTYDETLTLIRNEIGIPPPAYRSRNGSQSTNHSNRSNESTPQMSTRVLISRPTLMTVETLSRSDSSVNSSNDLLVAGPSGSHSASHQSLQSHQGIDNPAFC